VPERGGDRQEQSSTSVEPGYPILRETTRVPRYRFASDGGGRLDAAQLARALAPGPGAIALVSGPPGLVAALCGPKPPPGAPLGDGLLKDVGFESVVPLDYL